MIIVFESGRLGNQLFQYHFLLTYRKNEEKIIYFGFDEIRKLLKIESKIYFINKNYITKRLLHNKAIKLIINTKLFNVLNENIIDNKYMLLKNSGYFNNITISFENYFQNSALIIGNTILNFNNLIYNRAHLIYNNLKILKNTNTCFVHIRRGDYLFYPSINSPAVLPLEWYIKCINKILKFDNNTYFIFFTDDQEYTKINFKDYPNSTIFKSNSPIIDFLIMSQCNSGILSASSFAWWAAYSIYLKNNSHNLLAPKFWIGHKNKKWHPQFIESTFLKYIDV